MWCVMHLDDVGEIRPLLDEYQRPITFRLECEAREYADRLQWGSKKRKLTESYWPQKLGRMKKGNKEAEA